MIPYAQRLWRTLIAACSRSPPACACSLSASRLRRHPLTHAPRPWHRALRDLRTRPRSKTRRRDSCRRLYRLQLNLPRRREEKERPGREKTGSTRNEGGRQTQRTQGQGRLNYLSEARPTSSRSSTSRASPASGREFFWRGGVSPPARSRMRSRFRRRAISRNRKAPTSAPGGALSPVISHSRSTGSSASGHPLPPHNRSPARRPAPAPRPTPVLGGLPHTKYNRSARSASTDPRIKLSR